MSALGKHDYIGYNVEVVDNTTGDILGMIAKDHCATCFADGVQVITGCTFGKGNILKTHKGKWAVTLIDKKSGKGIRVTPEAEAMLANKQTPFFRDYREKGLPASVVPAHVVDPLVENVMGAPDEMILSVSEVFAHEHKAPPHSFDGFVCEECGEMVVMQYGRIKGDRKFCIDCAS